MSQRVELNVIFEQRIGCRAGELCRLHCQQPGQRVFILVRVTGVERIRNSECSVRWPGRLFQSEQTGYSCAAVKCLEFF